MNLGERILFAGKCFMRERARSRLRERGTPIDIVQSSAWPDTTRLKRHWRQETFVVFDTETTGLDPVNDHAVSIGAVAIKSGRIVMGETFDRIISAEKAPSRDSVVVHGIKPAAVSGGDDPQSVARDFIVWADDAVLVAHHAMFDAAMLNRAAEGVLSAPIQNLILDTVALAGRLENCDGDGYDLDSLLERYEIPGTGARHSALGDAMMTARLLQKLLKKLESRGASTLAAVATPGMRTHRL